MKVPRLRSSKNVVLSGDVAFFRLTITTPEPEALDYDHFRQSPMFVELMHEGNFMMMEGQVDEAVRRHLGNEFEARGISFARGSILVLVAIGTVYEVISKYKDFVESLERLLTDV